MTDKRPPAAPRTLTLRDVSEASGVSEMTVSRVLRNRGEVSDATREKVLQAAKRLGYVPNKIAGALASQRVNLVAVIIPSLSNMVFPEVMMGISDVLEGTALQPVVGVTNYRPEREEAVLYEMLSWRPSGVIIAGLEHSEASSAMLRAAGIPIVEIMDVDGEPVDSMVGISHRRAGGRDGARDRAGGLQADRVPRHRNCRSITVRKSGSNVYRRIGKGGIEMVDSSFYRVGRRWAMGER